MLVQFSVSNYKSIRDKAELSFFEANITEFPESLIPSADRVGILPVVMLYGANGSGKSTVLEALESCVQMAVAAQPLPGRLYFTFDPAMEQKPTAFDLVVRSAETEYEYQLKIRAGMVLEETLYARTFAAEVYDVIFDRDAEGIYMGELLKGTDVSPVTEEQPFLQYCFQVIPEHPLMSDFADTLTGIHVVPDQAPDQEKVRQICRIPDRKARLLNILAAADTGILDISPEEGLTVRYPGGEIPFLQESKGLQQMIGMFAHAVDCLEEGWVMVADDVNRLLHPKVLELLLRLFTDPSVNTRGAQLLGSSFDMPTMSNRVLRRDEIWICHKDAENAVSLYVLALFLKENGEKVRKDETYYKQFLEGRYGTDVQIGPVNQGDRRITASAV